MCQRQALYHVIELVEEDVGLVQEPLFTLAYKFECLLLQHLPLYLPHFRLNGQLVEAPQPFSHKGPHFEFLQVFQFAVEQANISCQIFPITAGFMAEYLGHLGIFLQPLLLVSGAFQGAQKSINMPRHSLYFLLVVLFLDNHLPAQLMLRLLCLLLLKLPLVHHVPHQLQLLLQLFYPVLHMDQGASVVGTAAAGVGMRFFLLQMVESGLGVRDRADDILQRLEIVGVLEKPPEGNILLLDPGGARIEEGHFGGEPSVHRE